MNKFPFLLLALLSIFFGCINSEKKTPAESGSTENQTENASNLPQYFYKRLEGTIEGKNVVVELNKSNNNAAGSYYYTTVGRSISLMLDTVVTPDSLILSSYVLGDQSNKNPKLYLKWNGKGFTGNYENEAGKLSSLSLVEAYPNWSYKLQPDSLSEAQKAFPTKADSPKAKIVTQYLVYSGKNSAWVNNTIKSIFGLKNNNDWNTALKSGFSKYFKDYANDVKQTTSREKSGDDLSFLNYESSLNASVKFNEKDFVVIQLMNYAYTGGAHGNYGSSFYNLDIAAQKVLKLQDILSADSTTLNKIGTTYFRKQFGLKPNEPLTKILFDKDLKLNNNFYINSMGISFLFNPYEIASYAQGQIDVFIPYDALKPYLNPVFKERMGIK